MKKTFLALAVLATLAGCAVQGIGDKQADTPPRIVIRQDSNNNDYRTWDNPGAFGPVPANMAAVGAKVCGSLNTAQTKYKALGYHARALNLEGMPFVGGGYYCVPDNQ